MSALSNLENSDTIFFNSISYNLAGPTQINPGPKQKTNICAGKAPGDLSFKLNTVKHFGIKQPYDFDVEFVAKDIIGPDVNGNYQVTWRVDQPINKAFPVPLSPGVKITVTVKDVKGSASTLIRQRNPRIPGPDCTGAGRSIGVDLQTQPGENKLTLYTDLFADKIQANNISLMADGRDDFAITGKINVVRDENGIDGIVPGGISRFWAQLENVPAGSGVGYVWAVSGGGASAVAATVTQPIFHVQLGSSKSPINVEVKVTVEGVDKVLKLTHTPDDAESVRAKTIRGHFESFLRVNMFIKPLLDDHRDYVAKPFSRSELQRIKRFSTDLLKETNGLLRLGKG